MGLERRDRHAFNSRGVAVGLKNDALAGLPSRKAGYDVGPAGRDLLFEGWDIPLLEEAPHGALYLGLSPAARIGRIDAVDSNQV